MNVFKIHQDYRDVGINYGLPVFYVDFGVGMSLSPEETARRLWTLGLRKGRWVILRNNPIGEKGCGVFVMGLKKLGVRVEVEDGGLFGTPGWFPQVDRWIVWYKENAKFNYGALRPRQDMLMYKGGDIVGFLSETEKWDVLRGIVVPEREDWIWEIIKDKEVRVYEDVQGDN
jgi:hypothetical protein